MRPFRQLASVVAGAAAATAFLVYCGGTPTSSADSTQADAGPKASCECPAPRILEAACDKEAVGAADSPTAVRRAYFAEVAVEGLDPSTAPAVAVVGCDQTCVGNGCRPWWAPGPTYPTSGYEPPAEACSPRPFRLAPGKVIVDCGNSRPATTSGDFDGVRYARAIVRVQL